MDGQKSPLIVFEEAAKNQVNIQKKHSKWRGILRDAIIILGGLALIALIGFIYVSVGD